MKVKMTTLECGPAGNFGIGEEREVSQAHGAQLIAANSAVLVREEATAKPHSEATAKPFEKPSTPAKESRSKGKGK